MEIKDLFLKPCIVEIAGDVDEAKSNLLYHIIEELKKEGEFNLYTYGLRKKVEGAIEIYSVEEAEKIRDSIVILDEILSLWDLDDRKAKKLIEKSLRLINHNNNILVVCGVPDNFRKFIAGKGSVFIFKRVTLADCINGSKVKNIILNYKGTELGSSVLNLAKNEAIIFNGHYTKIKIPYYKKYDSKLENRPIINVQKNVPKKVEVSEKEIKLVGDKAKEFLENVERRK